MNKLDKGRYRLYAGIANVGIGAFNLFISIATLALLVWKVL